MSEGIKLTEGKLRWDLLPFGPVTEVVRVITWALSKDVPYPANNWQLVKDPNEKFFAAALRHIVAWEKGELLDIESKLPHLAHAISNLLFLLWFQLKEAAMPLPDKHYEVPEEADDPIYPDDDTPVITNSKQHYNLGFVYGLVTAIIVGSVTGAMAALTFAFPCC